MVCVRQNILLVQQMIMRYFSHEIRTPLNSVYVGVTIMLHAALHAATSSSVRPDPQSSLLETAVDTHQSCQSALSILNSMILYDRILNGLVTLEKSSFDPWKLTCDVTNQFIAQVVVYFFFNSTGFQYVDFNTSPFSCVCYCVIRLKKRTLHSKL